VRKKCSLQKLVQHSVAIACCHAYGSDKSFQEAAFLAASPYIYIVVQCLLDSRDSTF
jgi:hypothetical protein